MLDILWTQIWLSDCWVINSDCDNVFIESYNGYMLGSIKSLWLGRYDDLGIMLHKMVRLLDSRTVLNNIRMCEVKIGYNYSKL